MRFTAQKELKKAYTTGLKDKKLIQRFLWFPVTIDGETRWLEEATYLCKVDYTDGVFFGRYYYWKPWEFCNK